MEENKMDQLTIENMTDISEMNGKYLTFWTDGQLFGIPIADVVQIVGMQEITSIPEFPHYAKGIINLRGSIIPVIDVRLRFNKPEMKYNERTCIVVTNIKESLIGFIVDEVDEVVKIDEEQISKPPQLSSERSDAHTNLSGIGKLQNKIVLLINSETMLSDDTIDFLTSAYETN
ncbi:chemotaxis protein CheW [Anaerovorax sp. IOR16]|uniref:chemotaxis protein CheW n=1 Tax=Anaerovorax sp. IOR16 TaxID=2773458 RepID=UPI001FD65999|nr:chemotaxis protein CheW [Anaerovorax sp. IOR16]